MSNIVVFASGSGTNAENIITYFSNRKSAKVVAVLSNRRDAYVFQRAAKLGIPSHFFDRNDFYNTQVVAGLLEKYKTDFIVLAGFLWLVPRNIIIQYSGRIVNIHPALLPSYGGKGMYGDHVHKSVIDNKESESGITIHYVNEKYDEGDIIFQAKCDIEPGETAESLASKIHKLEYLYYPEVIEKILTKN